MSATRPAAAACSRYREYRFVTRHGQYLHSAAAHPLRAMILLALTPNIGAEKPADPRHICPQRQTIQLRHRTFLPYLAPEIAGRAIAKTDQNPKSP